MGINIVSKTLDLSASPTTKIIPPISESLEYLNFFGGISDIHARNLAINKASALVIGSPLAGATFVELTSRVDYIATGVPQIANSSVTFVVIASPKQDNVDVSLIGNAGSQRQDTGAVTPGFNLFFGFGTAGDSTTAPVFSIGIDPSTGSGSNRSVTLGQTPFSDLATVFIAVYDHEAQTISLSDVGSGAYSEIDVSDVTPVFGEPFRVGSAYNASFDGTSQMTAAAIYSKALSLTERNDLYAWLQKIMSEVYGVEV